MTDPESTSGRPTDDEGSHASVGGDVERPEGGRTDAEAAVDEDLGTTPTE